MNGKPTLMRIVCPACSAAYEVEANSLFPGRKTRCMRCAAEWVPVQKTAAGQPDGGEAPHDDARASESKEETKKPPVEHPGNAERPVSPPAVTISLPPQPSAMERLSAAPARTTGGLPLHLAWAASVVLLLMAVAGLYEWRGTVMQIWPPSTQIYTVFGLAPAPDSPQR